MKSIAASEKRCTRNEASLSRRKKISVVYLTDKLAFGGTPLQIMELALHLDRRKFESHFILLSHVEPGLRDRLERNRISVDSLNQPNWIRPRATRGLWQLYRLLRQVKPDVIHAYLATSNVLGALVGRLASIPVIISSHRDLGGFDGEWTMRVNDFTDRRLAHCVTANSNAVREALVKRSGLRADSISLLYNGIDFRKVQRANRGLAKRKELGLAPDDLVVAMAANLKASKGHRYLVEAFNRLAPQHPNAKLLLCGYASDPEFEQVLRGVVQEAGTKPRVWFMDSRPDILEIMHAIDVLVSASLSEGFSNSILEAMAAGKPVIATAVGGNLEQVVHGVTGLIVPPADSFALQGALAELLSSPQQRRRFGLAAQRRIREKFTVETMVDEHERLYRDLLKDKR